MEKKIEIAISNFLNGTATQKQKEKLSNWLRKSQNIRLFEEFIRINLAVNSALAKDRTEEIKKLILKRDVISSGTKTFRLQKFYKYAAILLVAFIIGAYVFNNFSENEEQLRITEEFVTLQRDNGKPVVLKDTESKKFRNSEGEILANHTGKNLIYQDPKVKLEDEFHTLKVPYGKQFELVLSDGTIVKLNAGTNLRFPVSFQEKEQRIVYLEGEALFQVKENKDQPFIVETMGPQIEVLGTEFNVSAYLEDSLLSTTLVTGKVKVNLPGNSTTSEVKNILLQPGYMAVWNTENETVSVEEVDTSIFTAWTENKLVFRHIPFSEITKKLERHYNVEIISENPELNGQRYSATFDVETIQDVLELFSKTYSINYKIKNNQIIIK